MSNAKLPSFKFLVGFEAAARLGNYSRAADELFVSQSAISHQIAQLERHVGQVLFRHKGRGVELTVAGRLLLESVTRSLEVIRSGLGRIETYLDKNLVTLVCPAPVAHGWLQPRVDALIAAHPLLCPIISVDETARYIDEMDVDIAISREPLKQPGVFELPFLSDELVVVCTPEVAATLPARSPASHPKRVGLLCLEADLTGERTGPFIRETFSAFRKVALYDDPRLLLDAAVRGRGLALLSHLMADDALARGQLVRLPKYPGLSAGTLWISRADGEHRSPLVRGVFDSLLHLSQPA
jgi:LysR family transcriptional regulator, glycine cleavage system transcriptional activator